jgi:phage terminase large subunit-like protein
MGARGVGARPARPHIKKSLYPWEAPRLTRAARVIRFIEHLQITSGTRAGQKFKLEPFQKEIIREWFKTDRNGKRIVRTAVLSIARKNGKSTLIAALALAFLVGPERERRGQIVVGAADRDQSGIIFDEIEAMLDADETLRGMVNVKRHEKTIEELELGSRFRALSSDAKKAHGLSPSVVILDELAQWGSGIGLRLYNALMTASGARAEPLKIIISTQADNDQAKMSELLDYGEQVNAGVIVNPRFWCRLYEVPEDLDPFDEKHWRLANPGLGTIRGLEDLRELAERARRMPTERAAFENLYCNRRISAEERWIAAPDWNACHGKVDIETLVGEPCYGGLDLGSVNDLTSFSLYWPHSGALLSWSWCPADRIAERAERDRVPYDIWSRDGWLELTPGRATNKRMVVLRLAELNALYQPKIIGYDKWGMDEVLRVMDEEAVELPLQEFRQGYVSFSPAAKAFAERVLNRQIRHDNPLLTWPCLMCACRSMQRTTLSQISQKVASALTRSLPA